MLNEATVADFRARLHGGLIEAGDPSYDAARKVYNAMIDRRPRLIARCADVADVMAAVNFAREQKMLFSRALGISWRSSPAGVALGFGVTASVGIAAMVLHSRLGGSFFSADIFRLAGFHVCILVWLWYIVHPEPALNPRISCTVIADLSRQAEEFHSILSD